MLDLGGTAGSRVPTFRRRTDVPWRRLTLATFVALFATLFADSARAEPPALPVPARQWSLLPPSPPAEGMGLGLAPAARHDGETAAESAETDSVEVLSPHPHLPPGDSPLAFGHRLATDVRDLLGTPRHMDARDWRLLATGALVIGIAHLADDDARATVLRHGGGDGGRDWAESIRPLGKEGGLVLAALAWASGEATGRDELSDMAQDSLEATVISAALVAPLLKATVGRPRPRSGDGSESVSDGGESFPSGEVTQAFAMASVIAAHSRHRWVDVLAWSGAGLIAWERMRLDAHWLSDVTAGALIGAGIGRWIVRRNHPEVLQDRRDGRRLGASWQMQPLFGEHRAGLAVRVRF